jgi:cell fate regulator YaaT (PSP1 superfamily)
MAILPLPQFEADLEEDRKTYAALKTPKTLVVRFGAMKMVGEFPNDSGAKPGCGSKLVVRTHRGTELGEMLTSTCPNSGCSKSVSRQDMLGYIENSGGRDYPFSTDGRVLRVATAEDLARQSQLEQMRHGLRMQAKALVEEMGIPVKVVDAETMLGNERIVVYFFSEDRVELGDLGTRLSRVYHNRVDLRQIGARDEARITADYERCGQYCCCKNFLKVLKPVSMKSAKIQKATLDPLKISGRCGRLMCCLRYEDETYETLRKRLPKKKARVGTPEGDGFVVDSQILTQLVLVELDEPESDGKIRRVAIAVEDLAEPKSKTPPPPREPAAGFAPRGARSKMPRESAKRDFRPGPIAPNPSAGATGSADSSADAGDDSSEAALGGAIDDRREPRPDPLDRSRPASDSRSEADRSDTPRQGVNRPEGASRNPPRPLNPTRSRKPGPGPRDGRVPPKPVDRRPPAASDSPTSPGPRGRAPDRGPGAGSGPPGMGSPGTGSAGGGMNRSSKPTDDFGDDELDDLLGGGDAGRGSGGTGGTPDPNRPRRRRRRRRGGGPGGQGPDQNPNPGPNQGPSRGPSQGPGPDPVSGSATT